MRQISMKLLNRLGLKKLILNWNISQSLIREAKEDGGIKKRL
jgi:hypothetical protein